MTHGNPPGPITGNAAAPIAAPPAMPMFAEALTQAPAASGHAARVRTADA